MASKDRVGHISLHIKYCVVERDFFTLTSTIPRLQAQCPCMVGP